VSKSVLAASSWLKTTTLILLELSEKGYDEGYDDVESTFVSIICNYLWQGPRGWVTLSYFLTCVEMV